MLRQLRLVHEAGEVDLDALGLREGLERFPQLTLPEEHHGHAASQVAFDRSQQGHGSLASYELARENDRHLIRSDPEPGAHGLALARCERAGRGETVVID